MSGEYVYLATSAITGEPIGAFVRKYELENWCRTQEKLGYPNGYWLALYGIRTLAWEGRTDLREFEYVDGRLTERKK